MNQAVYNSDLTALFTDQVPLLDVRSEIEFAKGSLPNSINIPILSTAERHAVGICYKSSGQDAAIALGHELVSGNSKEQRIKSWLRWTNSNPAGALLCWRGGMRSKIAQEWIASAGVNVPRIPGGYKAVRRRLLAALDELCRERTFFVLAGETGAGKTQLLHDLNQSCIVLDLEHHARHRGSAFGAVYGEQPAQQTFENALTVDFIRQTASSPGPVIVEAESRMIGLLFVPDPLMKTMNNCSIVAVRTSLEKRIDNVIQDYVTANPLKQQADLSDYFSKCLMKLSKRLGLELTKKLISIASEACRCDSVEMHREWIGILLTDYYDPYYEEYLRRNAERIVYRSEGEDTKNFLLSHNIQK